MKKYPPLPDIVLDNLPYIPWAFEMCEMTGLVLSSIMICVLFFHKHRFVNYEQVPYCAHNSGQTQILGNHKKKN